MSGLLDTFLQSAYDRLFDSTYTTSDGQTSGYKIVAPCNISEHHIDQNVITEHPVEYGAPINDHKYQLMPRVDISIAFSQSGNLLRALGSAIPGVSSLPISVFGNLTQQPKTIQQYYQIFLNMKNEGNLIKIVTGKRKYENMVIDEIDTITNADMENAIILNVKCRQILIVFTSISNTSGVPMTDWNTKVASPSQSGLTQLDTPTSSLTSNFQQNYSFLGQSLQ